MGLRSHFGMGPILEGRRRAGVAAFAVVPAYSRGMPFTDSVEC